MEATLGRNSPRPDGHHCESETATTVHAHLSRETAPYADRHTGAWSVTRVVRGSPIVEAVSDLGLTMVILPGATEGRSPFPAFGIGSIPEAAWTLPELMLLAISEVTEIVATSVATGGTPGARERSVLRRVLFDTWLIFLGHGVSSHKPWPQAADGGRRWSTVPMNSVWVSCGSAEGLDVGASTGGPGILGGTRPTTCTP